MPKPEENWSLLFETPLLQSGPEWWGTILIAPCAAFAFAWPPRIPSAQINKGWIHQERTTGRSTIRQANRYYVKRFENKKFKREKSTEKRSHELDPVSFLASNFTSQQQFVTIRACPICPFSSQSRPFSVMLAKSESVTWIRGLKSCTTSKGCVEFDSDGS